MIQYPTVLDEWATLQHVQAGGSLARYGDGELAVSDGRAIYFQSAQPVLATRLRTILRGDAGRCLVGIPHLMSSRPLPKAVYWQKYRARFALATGPGVYGSSFVTRPDNAPWLNVPCYWQALESLWRDRHVVLVRGSDLSLVAADLTSATAVREVLAPSVDAWAQYDALLEAVGRPDVALLCLGPTATVMAVDLCARGVQAIDLGHVGMFLHWHRQGLPMTNKKPHRQRVRA